MTITRREFIHLLSLATTAGLVPKLTTASRESLDFYAAPKFGNLTLLHITDTHAQLNPVYFREPSTNLGIGPTAGKVPHLVGEQFLKQFHIAPNTANAHALTSLNFTEAAQKYGSVGGFAHLKTLIDQIRAERGPGNSLLLDGGDTWQGSGTAYWTRGQDMVDACNLLGVEVMTGHWEFTYKDEEVIQNLKNFHGDFVAQNIRVREEALFDYRFADAPDFDEDSGLAFKPYTIKSVGGIKVAVIGQAFPYTPIANPQRFIPDWTFGIQETALQNLIDKLQRTEKPDVIVLLSHNGMDVDLKLASRVTGIDVILGGHTHDGIPAPIPVLNRNGTTLVTNAGSHGKFLGVLDLQVANHKLQDFRYRLLPVFSKMLPANLSMQTLIEKIRAPYKARLEEKLAVTEDTLYRRGTFNGTFDQVICDALRSVNDAQISLSPGFRWGASLLPGQIVTMEDLLNQTCITYPETYRREMAGAELKAILEDVADNLFNPDPYVQQGGDMVRAGGLNYTLDPTEKIGHRITDLTLDDGSIVAADKRYMVAGWATVAGVATGRPIWEVCAEYLRDKNIIRKVKLNVPKLKV